MNLPFEAWLFLIMLIIIGFLGFELIDILFDKKRYD